MLWTLMLLCGLLAAPKAQAAIAQNKKVSQTLLDDYERAINTIQNGKNYRIFTMVGTQKYYVTADGRLSNNVDYAPLFHFSKVMGTANDREYEYGFHVQQNGFCFTNPYDRAEEYLTQGHLNYTNKNMRPTWEAQVFFLNTDGKYAIRSTNSPYSSDHENWGWIGSAFWTVNSSASGPLAEYSFDMNYVWQLEGESITSGDICPDGNHPHKIDLGLPSGILWSCCNVDATSPEDRGGYYAWGETTTKTDYSWGTYAHRDTEEGNYKYIGNTIAGTDYDVAHVKWGDNWKMPENSYYNELEWYCSTKWVTFNNVNGRLYTGPNGHKIFLPAAGYGRYDGVSYDGTEGIYLSADLNASQFPKYYKFSSSQASISQGSYEFGCPVRPVAPPESSAHVHDLEQAGGNPPTCTEWGYEVYWYCTTCNKMFSDDQGHNEISNAPSIPPLGHDLGTRPGVEPTCTASGRTGATVCKRCGAIYEASQEIPALGHDFGTRPGVEPTCTEPGFTEATVCRRCGEIYEAAQEIPALGHIWGDWVVIREATTTEVGEERRTCQRDESHIETRYVATIVISGLFINETNFPDANFRNILLEEDYGKDGLLTDEEIANITKLYVGGENIADLTGIEHFTALKELYCFDNQLTTLDVSKNTTLELLSCYNNQLTTLDVSQNTALQTLYCHENQLTTLDVSKNTALQSLSCRENQLTALKVSKDSPLTMLNCLSNQLSGEAMDALVESMPVVADGRFTVLNALDANEQNVITKTQVAAAKAKGWSVMRLVGDMGEYENYEGFDNQPDAIRTVSLTAGDDSWYTLDGVKLSGKPTRKGLYLLNGHKVVVK